MLEGRNGPKTDMANSNVFSDGNGVNSGHDAWGPDAHLQQDSDRAPEPPKRTNPPSKMQQGQQEAAQRDLPLEILPAKEEVPVQMVMEENAGAKRGEHDVDWDKRTGWIAAVARFSHDHYYISLFLFLFLTLGLTAVIMVVPTNKKCAEEGSQFTVCEASNHDWELSYQNASRYKDATGLRTSIFLSHVSYI